MEKDICGIFVAEYESMEKARTVVNSMKNCPHLIMAGVTGERTSMVFIVPETLRWWFELPADNPEAFGAKTMQVFILDDIVYPEEFTPRLPEIKIDTPPCGSKCSECPIGKQHDCPGCPATVNYKG